MEYRVPPSPRNMNATKAARGVSQRWRSVAAHCRAYDWPPARLLYELPRLLCRTHPPGHETCLQDPEVLRRLHDRPQVLRRLCETSELQIQRDVKVNPHVLILAIEIMLPDDAEVPTPPADAPATSPAPSRPSDAAVKACFFAIKKERPNPPSEPELLAEMKSRLGAPPGRERVRDLWKVEAPQWKRPRGHPRKSAV